MNETLRLSPLEWDLLARLREALRRARQAEAPIAQAAMLTTALKAFQFPQLGTEAKLLNVGDLMPEPMRVVWGTRVGEDGFAERAARLLIAADADEADSILVALSEMAPRLTTILDERMLLAYASPGYRLHAVGLGSDPPPQDGDYDGPPVILRMLGGRFHFNPPSAAVFSPDEVRRIADDITALRLADFPVGDVKPQLDFFEDFYESDEDLDLLWREDLDAVMDLYQTAAAGSHGVWVRA